jgi:predicted DCC family thiol-disulfide oxidoreductase YuxK
MSGILYTIGWFLLAWGGASGNVFFPLCFSWMAIIWQIVRTSGKIHYLDLFAVLYLSLFGFVIESINVRTGWVSYRDAGTTVPFWILTLYPLFGLTLNHTLSFLKRSWLLAFVLGGIGGLLSYRSGEAMGAVQVHGIYGWIFLGVVWAVLVPGVLMLIRKVDLLADLVLTEKSPLKMLYDGGCPVCRREVNYLKKRNESGLVEFIDIDPLDSYDGISKKEAMQEMLVLDAKGTVLRGVDAFFALYGRVNLPGLALFLKAPLFYPLNKVGYRIFARIRPYFNTNRKTNE